MKNEYDHFKSLYNTLLDKPSVSSFDQPSVSSYYKIKPLNDGCFYVDDTAVYIFNDKFQYHRLDGPAIIYKSGVGDEWCINGKSVDHLIYDWAEENDIDLNNLSIIDISLIKIIWADYGKGKL